MKRAVILAAAMFLFDAGTAKAEGTWGGLMFGDAYWFAQHHEVNFRGLTGFQIRRVYLEYDNDIGEGWSTRFRFEINHAGNNAAGANPAISAKDVYLKHKNGTHAGYFGIQSYPAFDLEEGFWGYRPVEKTPLDLQGWRSSRDTGIGLKGDFDEGKMFGYHTTVGNGAGQSQETNKNMQYALALHVNPVEGMVLQVFQDYQNNNRCAAGAAAGPGNCVPKTSDYVTGLFAGYKGDWGRVGASYRHRVSEQGNANLGGVGAITQTFKEGSRYADVHANIVSAFAVAQFTDRFAAYARADYLDYPAAAAPTYFNSRVTNARSALFLLGVDQSYADGDVHIMPNIEIMAYGAPDKTGYPLDDSIRMGDRVAKGRPRPIVIPRISFFWKFK